jgi:hypothetical protein
MGAYSQFIGQLQSWYGVAAALSGVLTAWASIWYFMGIFQRKTKPSTISFSLWTLLQAVALAAQLKEGSPSLSVVFMGLLTLDTALVTMLALAGFGHKKYEWHHPFSFAAAVAAAAMLWRNPNSSILIAIAGDVAACLPTVIKTRREPWTEHWPPWALITASSIFGALSSDRWDVANLAFPAYLAVANGTILCLAFFGRKRKPASTS